MRDRVFDTFRQLSARGRSRRYRVGLALSGGVAYGLSQIGVLKVLERTGVRVDCLAGTSAGAIIAAGYAAGVPLEELEAMAVHTSFKQLFSLRPSRKGLVSSEPIERYVRDNFRVSTFEELVLPLAVVTTDICSGEEAVFTRGPLDRAVRASCSIPGIYSPVDLAGLQLVDGGLVENVPVRALRSLGADVVIAVNVMGHRKVFKKASNVIQILMRVWNFFVQENRTWAAEADVVLEPDLRIYDLFDFSSAAEIIRVGEKEAKTKLPVIKRSIGMGKRVRRPGGSR
jgi:NTE family protein